jgi:outer membrane lipoprotein-sorting protein
MTLKYALILAAIMSVACVPLNAFAAQTPAAWNLHALMSAFAKHRATKVKFHERKYLGVLSRPLDLSGTLVYRAPDTLTKRVVAPVRETYRVSGNTVRFKRQGKPPRQFSLDAYPALRALIESIRATLGGDGATLRRLYSVMLDGDRAHWTLKLTPKLPPLKRHVHRIQLTGHNGRIVHIVTVEANGDRSIMELGTARAGGS